MDNQLESPSSSANQPMLLKPDQFAKHGKIFNASKNLNIHF